LDSVKTVCVGAAVALTAGLLMGAAMKPDLLADDRPAGPQMFADPGPRPTGPFDDAVSYASYPVRAGKTPDYVLGADWKKLMAPPPAPRPPILVDETPQEAEPPPALDDAADVAVDDAAPPPPAAGPGDAYDDASRAEKTPVTWRPDGEVEAEPNATGDTRRAP
jgi:hypothetical protein